MGAAVIKLENISDDKFNEMLSTGWTLVSVDQPKKNELVYNFVRAD